MVVLLQSVPGMAETDILKPISFSSWARRLSSQPPLQLGVAMCLNLGLWNVARSALLCF